MMHGPLGYTRARHPVICDRIDPHGASRLRNVSDASTSRPHRQKRATSLGLGRTLSYSFRGCLAFPEGSWRRTPKGNWEDAQVRTPLERRQTKRAARSMAGETPSAVTGRVLTE